MQVSAHKDKLMSQLPSWYRLGSHAFSWTDREIECRVDMYGRSVDKQDAVVPKSRELFHPRKSEG
jgi:hypothetical protein